MPSLVGALQHLENISSCKQAHVKKLFQRMFESEFTDKFKYMTLNATTETSIQNDSNALLRHIAILYPDDITWKQGRSFMLGEVTHVRADEVHVKGYIRQNFLNAKRLMHITGLPV